MLDLKAKLASAGLVSQDDIARAEAQKKNRKKGKRKKKSGAPGKAGVRPLNVAALKDVKKGELYDAVRRWVDKTRLDPRGVPSESCAPFHFPQIDGRVGRLMMEPALSKRIQAGEAAVIAFMSNSGLAHAVVPAAGARDLASLKPEWLRVLPGDDRAGSIVKE